ncbi:DUF3558 domain-containing protein [Nocardia neocaledoniensis]|uniref:DUF3558 domain-containing protein n=1 Tax=Nocardia neocaledoniensis TaxID=236511 RepID=UPI002455CB6F|nr:DUF3558 domain-containing protein [Nocardia neocaledoniensis]
MSSNWTRRSRSRTAATSLASLAVIAVAVSSCGSDHEPGAAPTTRPSAIQVTVSAAPTMGEGDLKVAFDPCTLSDATISETGYDPRTRERSPGEIVSGMYTALGCTFSKSADNGGAMTGRLTILSTSTTLAETQSEHAATVYANAPVEGRRAVIYRPEFPNSCTTAIETSDGTLTIEASEYPRAGADGEPLPGTPDPCGQIDTTASAVARALK